MRSRAATNTCFGKNLFILQSIDDKHVLCFIWYQYIFFILLKFFEFGHTVKYALVGIQEVCFLIIFWHSGHATWQYETQKNWLHMYLHPFKSRGSFSSLESIYQLCTSEHYNFPPFFFVKLLYKLRQVAWRWWVMFLSKYWKCEYVLYVLWFIFCDDFFIDSFP